MKSLFFSFAITMCFAQTVFAQTNVGFGLQLGVPLNEFRANTQAVGAGVNLNLYTPFAPKVPIYLGFNLGYMMYGSFTQRINENLGVYAQNGALLSNIPVNLNVTTNNNMLNGNIALRIKAPLTSVQPYIEGVAGFNYLYTRTSIYDETPNKMFTSNQQSNLINARTQAQSFVLQYGAGGGFLVKIGENTYLDIRATYTIGGRAQYYDRSQTQNWKVTFAGTNYSTGDPVGLSTQSDAKKSNTDLLLINFGLSFAL